MNLALNDLQGLICHKTKPNKNVDGGEALVLDLWRGIRHLFHYSSINLNIQSVGQIVMFKEMFKGIVNFIQTFALKTLILLLSVKCLLV